jgi:hypothetical protein
MKLCRHDNEETAVMNASQWNVQRATTAGTGRVRLAGLLLGHLLLAAPSFAALAEDNFETNALLRPSESQLAAEERGRVMIYDGLDNRAIDHALDAQFERIEHMMFIRIQQREADGTVTVEDDGC